jgi:hypothetical protein
MGSERALPPQAKSTSRMSHFIRTLWLAAFAIASLPACGDPAGDAALVDPIEWECGFERPGDPPAVEEKFVLPKYYGMRPISSKPCYGVPETHQCLALPYTKNFYWHFGDSMAQYLGMLSSVDLEALAGFYGAIDWLNQESGFTFTETAGPTGLDNDITIDWAWNPEGDLGSAICGVAKQTVTQNAPGQVSSVVAYKGCHMSINVGAWSWVVTSYAGSEIYDIAGWDVGFATAIHEFGHIMGIGHAVIGIMKAKMTAATIDNPNYTLPMLNATLTYNPTISAVTVPVIPGFTPHISE